jgi:AAA domain, putative AbiEii toxin, Type IV TA system
LTILAGANSSGKSSIMQPLLMLKQTLEATYDPGPLKIDGSHVRFTDSEQFLSRTGEPAPKLIIELAWHDTTFEITFEKGKSEIQVVEQGTVIAGRRCVLRPNMTADEIAREFELLPDSALHVVRDRFFLGVASLVMPNVTGVEWIIPALRAVIHVRGVCGSPTRTYPVAAVGPIFSGTFEPYIASVIAHWQNAGSNELQNLNGDLRHMWLTRLVKAKRQSEAEIDLQVSRHVDGRDDDLVSIADVGVGVSQVLPVVVALRTADRGRLVYLEEPESHLHPRAQTKLADILAGAAKRGVRVVAETHSTLLLTAIQTLVAKGDLGPDLVKLHWFQRNPKTGITRVTSADLDENGAFGDWPEDFGEVFLDAEGAYLDAVEDRKVP